ncbi:unnamed protein product [Hymenolepis diminuta]|uniref:Uncharacterized protein n=1 Tax=Hymenolepis diminuta TaxID=6216 RepID=A0A564Y838_HYMDI|nr:unnamed protein product [Hymenolepis diminuta]
MAFLKTKDISGTPNAIFASPLIISPECLHGDIFYGLGLSCLMPEETTHLKLREIKEYAIVPLSSLFK